jgi:hypothetical protein
MEKYIDVGGFLFSVNALKYRSVDSFLNGNNQMYTVVYKIGKKMSIVYSTLTYPKLYDSNPHS